MQKGNKVSSSSDIVSVTICAVCSNKGIHKIHERHVKSSFFLLSLTALHDIRPW